MARLDRLGSAKRVAQLGATIGREFSSRLLEQIVPDTPDVVQRALRQLIEAEILQPLEAASQGDYMFRHALIQDTAYQSQLRRDRQHVHAQIVEALPHEFPDIASTQPEILAHHCTEAQLYEQAVGYWHQAGRLAQQRAAHQESIHHLQQGINVLNLLPATGDRDQQELDLQIGLIPPLMAVRGFAAPEIEQVHTRAYELSQQVAQTTQLIPLLRGLWPYYNVSGQRQKARDITAQFWRLADNLDDLVCRIEANRCGGGDFLFSGDPARAVAHLEDAVELYYTHQEEAESFRYVTDPAATSLPFIALGKWFLGYPDQAVKRSQESEGLARNLSSPFNLTFVLTWAAILYMCRREKSLVLERLEELIELGAERGFAQLVAIGNLLQGGIATAEGHTQAGLSQMRRALDTHEATGARLHRSCFHILLAEAYGLAGQADAGLEALRVAAEISEQTEERYYEAELYRLRGELLLKCTTPAPEEAQHAFQHGIEIARNQQAKSWELRATTSLARLWQSQGKRQDAYDLLESVYDWFTEGFDTADLQDAKKLLDELERVAELLSLNLKELRVHSDHGL